uniref:Uncharacterized protein n=1 Tax=Anguilla anguilla TaxID=7936 RepID=A0A0E9SYH6_ANGAN
MFLQINILYKHIHTCSVVRVGYGTL